MNNMNLITRKHRRVSWFSFWHVFAFSLANINGVFVTVIEENETTDGHRCFVDKTADRPSLQENPLKRTGKLFGGLIHDIKRRYPYYISDFKDGLNAQCVGSILFMFFAVLAPAITFGGLLGTNSLVTRFCYAFCKFSSLCFCAGEKTYGWMGTTEVLIAQSICGLLWALFSAQPLLIMGATGPLLVFEKSLYDVKNLRMISAVF